MVLEYLNPKIIATENMNQFLTTKDYKIYSQANHLSKMLELKNQIKSEVNHLMSQYSYKDGIGGLELMNTKYGKLSNVPVEVGLESYMDKIFKILRCKKNVPPLTIYIQGLIREFMGNSSLMEGLLYEKEFLSLAGTLENLISDDIKFEEFRSDVFKSISIVKKMKKNLGDNHGNV